MRGTPAPAGTPELQLFTAQLSMRERSQKWAQLMWPIRLCQRRQGYPTGKRQPFQWWCWENWAATSNRMKLDYFLTPYTKINSRWIRGSAVWLETIKPLEENTSSMLLDISLNIFLEMSPQVRETKAKINKWDYIKLKCFRTAKETVNKTKHKPGKGSISKV